MSISTSPTPMAPQKEKKKLKLHAWLLATTPLQSGDATSLWVQVGKSDLFQPISYNVIHFTCGSNSENLTCFNQKVLMSTNAQQMIIHFNCGSNSENPACFNQKDFKSTDPNQLAIKHENQNPTSWPKRFQGNIQTDESNPSGSLGQQHQDRQQKLRRLVDRHDLPALDLPVLVFNLSNAMGKSAADRWAGSVRSRSPGGG